MGLPTFQNIVIYATHTIIITEHGTLIKMYTKPCQKTGGGYR